MNLILFLTSEYRLPWSVFLVLPFCLFFHYFLKKKNFIVVRTVNNEIYPLNGFLSEQYSIVI